MPKARTRSRTKAPAWQKRDNNREARIQAAAVQYVELVAPQVYVVHIPNGGPGRSLSRLKWMGAKSGVADLIIIDEHGLAYFAECKDVDGKLTPDQIAFRDFCRERRYPWALVRSVNDMADALREWKIHTREAR